MKKKTLLQKFVDLYFGRDHSFCNHRHVDIEIVDPVTLTPRIGTCRNCKRKVTARLIWKEKEEWKRK